jgi:hypothetical protein
MTRNRGALRFMLPGLLKRLQNLANAQVYIYIFYLYVELSIVNILCYFSVVTAPAHLCIFPVTRLAFYWGRLPEDDQESTPNGLVAPPRKYLAPPKIFLGYLIGSVDFPTPLDRPITTFDRLPNRVISSNECLI